MSDLVLRPRSVTEIIDAAFQIYRRSPVPFMLAVGLVYIPWYATWVYFAGDLSIARTTLPPGFARFAVVGGVVSILLYALSAGVVSVLTRAAYLDEPIDLAAAFRKTFGRFLPLIAATLMQAVSIFIGFVLFLIPGFYLFGRLFAVPQVVVLEDAGAIAAFGRTGVLSQGRKLAVLGTFILVVLLAWVVNIGAGMIAGLLPTKVLSTLILVAVSVVVTPLFAITQTVLYFDSRIRNEGFDVEYLARAGTGGTPPTGVTA